MHELEPLFFPHYNQYSMGKNQKKRIEKKEKLYLADQKKYCVTISYTYINSLLQKYISG